MNQHEADELVLNMLQKNLSSRVEVYRIEGADIRNSLIETWDGPVLFDTETNDPDNPAEHAYFVDEMPEANWEHPCQYIIVRKSGSVSVKEETAPPVEGINLVRVPD
jgi:hypothetical protein